MGELKQKFATAIALSIIAATLLVTYLNGKRAPYDPKGATCLSNLKHLALASIGYQADNDDRFEPPSRWMDCITKYNFSEKLLRDPDRAGNRYGYAHDSRLLNLGQADIPDPATQPLIYDSSTERRNASYPFASLPYPSRHMSDKHDSGKNNVAYTDGGVRSIPAEPNTKSVQKSDR